MKSPLLPTPIRRRTLGRFPWVAILAASVHAPASAVTLPIPSAWVVNSGDDSVSVVSLSSVDLVATIPVGDSPGAIALTPDHRRAYVSNRGSNTVSAIDTETGDILSTIPVGNGPGRLTVSPNGQHVYVPNFDSDSVSVISVASNTVVGSFSTPDSPNVAAFHPTRPEIWVGASGVPSVSVYAASDHAPIAGTNDPIRYYGSTDLTFLAGGALALGAEGCGRCGRFHFLSGATSDSAIPVLDRDVLYDNTGAALAVESNPISGVVYLAKLGQRGPHRVVEFGGAGRSIEMPADPRGLTVSQDGARLYVAQNANPGSVAVIDTATMTTIGSLPAGAFPQDVAIVTGDATPPSLATNIALNPVRVGFPSPLESDGGWGGGSQKWDLVDGLRSYNHWANGLAFTDGQQEGAGSPGWIEPAGIRQATIDFGEPRTFDRATIWHHGDIHTPAEPDLAYWNGSEWIAIEFEREYGRMRAIGTNSGDSESDEYSFAPVTGSKFSYAFDNSGLNVLGEPNVHGWLYEIEVHSASEYPIGDMNQDGQVDRSDLAQFLGFLGNSTGSTPLTGDFDGDGAATLHDLNLLRANYGHPATGSVSVSELSSSNAVPEPANIAFVLAAALCGTVMKCRRQKLGAMRPKAASTQRRG